MAAWITVYLRRDAPALDGRTIERGIADADWWTLGEAFDLDEAAVNAFRATLRFVDDPLSFEAETSRRPIFIHVWADPARVREEVRELDERASVTVPPAVRAHLAGVRSIVAIELGWTQLETMFEIVAFEIAYWLAATCDGVILGPNDRWFDHDKHRWNPFESTE